MKNFTKLCVAILASTFAFSASATPIKIVALPDGAHPAALGDNDEYVMTPFVAPTDGPHGCTASPSGGQVCFIDGDTDPTNGAFGSSIQLVADDPDWWQWDGSPPPDHGNIFVVDAGRHLVDLILPANTRAFSLFVGSSAGGSAWIQAFDDHNNATHREYFGVGNNDTRGYGIYTTGCSSLTRITVEPFQWGFGYFSSNQGECRSVPEPGTLVLLGLGLLGLALSRRTRLQSQLA